MERLQRGVKELERELNKVFVHCDVRLRLLSGERLIVAGEVRQPNIYPVPPGTTVAQVIAMAGGPSDRGRLDRVQLIRRSGATMLDITRPEVGAARVEVNSGDEIIIGRRRSIMQDVIGPSSGILAALASVTGVVIQLTRHK